MDGEYYSVLLIHSLDGLDSLDRIRRIVQQSGGNITYHVFPAPDFESEDHISEVFNRLDLSDSNLNYRLVQRYQNQANVMNKLVALSCQDSFEQEDICWLIDRSRATFYRDIKRYDITGKYDGRVKMYTRQDVEKLMTKRGVLILLEETPVYGVDRCFAVDRSPASRHEQCNVNGDGLGTVQG